jgi:hypothetical protein
MRATGSTLRASRPRSPAHSSWIDHTLQSVVVHCHHTVFGAALPDHADHGRPPPAGPLKSHRRPAGRDELVPAFCRDRQSRVRPRPQRCNCSQAARLARATELPLAAGCGSEGLASGGRVARHAPGSSPGPNRRSGPGDGYGPGPRAAHMPVVAAARGGRRTAVVRASGRGSANGPMTAQSQPWNSPIARWAEHRAGSGSAYVRPSGVGSAGSGDQTRPSEPACSGYGRCRIAG